MRHVSYCDLKERAMEPTLPLPGLRAKTLNPSDRIARRQRAAGPNPPHSLHCCSSGSKPRLHDSENIYRPRMTTRASHRTPTAESRHLFGPRSSAAKFVGIGGGSSGHSCVCSSSSSVHNSSVWGERTAEGNWRRGLAQEIRALGA